MLENYRLNISDCAYISAHFWPYDAQMNVFPDPDSFLGIAVMWCILGSSMVSVIYFAIRCYRWLSSKLSDMESISESMKSLQKQLFHALIVQSAIPLFLMYIPAGMVFVFPMLNTELGLKYPFIGITIAVYPAIDPLPTMLIIRSYRRGCVDLFRKFTFRRRNQVSVHSNLQSTTAFDAQKSDILTN
ncbi:hypothetical protein GCK72_016935 [Caenorhabditis remanei]|uniref:Seven TM Receptor n=1 Tax=Caenorhabditis remanei TaxID=31234 RepID=A0A6A5G687_CAERE|nr:hypothetical protein GCK72_016935 [Caenorhabditis remanei]KAF1750386.1 hypothetical protein GCK72_016935 [Caenorhabditis remanei]